MRLIIEAASYRDPLHNPVLVNSAPVQDPQVMSKVPGSDVVVKKRQRVR